MLHKGKTGHKKQMKYAKALRKKKKPSKRYGGSNAGGASIGGA